LVAKKTESRVSSSDASMSLRCEFKLFFKITEIHKKIILGRNNRRKPLVFGRRISVSFGGLQIVYEIFFKERRKLSHFCFGINIRQGKS
jgi:hypothetical protein